MKIELIKDYKLLKKGDVITVDGAYALSLIKKGVAKEFGVEAVEEVEAKKPKK